MKKNMTLIIGILITLVLSISISYAFFYYEAEGEEITLTSGNITIKFEEETNYINIDSVYPKNDNIGKISSNYYDFSVIGSKGYEEILYQIQLDLESGNTLDDKYVKVYLTDQSDNLLVSPRLISDLDVGSNGKPVIYSNYIHKLDQVDNYRLRVWIDKSYTENVVNTFNFKVNIYAINEKVETLSNKLSTNLESVLLESDGDARIVAGNSETVNNNYLWYSGKLWRITAINDDGSIKLVTDNSITTISWGENSDFEGSYIYQWLNEDFKDTLYNYDELLVNDYLWNATQSNTTYEKPLETLMIKCAVGLLNEYEYYRSNSNIGYLNMGYNWWLLTKNNNYVKYVKDTGIPYNNFVYMEFSVRPSIVLKNTVVFTEGDGTINNPYRIFGDIEKTTNSNLYYRISGEYVNFNGELYRIENIYNNQVKIVKNDFYTENNNVVFKYVTDSIYYAQDNSSSNSSEHWDTFLNNIWYSQMPIKYKEMIVSGKWYYGIAGSGESYKETICHESDLNNTTKTCKKNDSVVEAYIGLGRYGEMFSSQPLDKSKAQKFALITRTSKSRAHMFVDVGNETYDSYGDEGGTGGNRWMGTVRPSMYLNESVYIKSGSGTINDPFEIAM